MSKLLVLFFALVIVINAKNINGDDDYAANFHRFIHNKAFHNGTRSYGMEFFPKASKLFTSPFGKLNNLTKKAAWFALDFLKTMNVVLRNSKRFVVREGEETAPESVDWRDRGAVTPVKNQGQCGSCWAFAATGSLEALYKNRTGELVELSQQYLLDCSEYLKVRNGVEDKCQRGNHVTRVLPFIKANGMVREADYPYTAIGGECNKARAPTEFHQINELMYTLYDERAMKEALHRYGPLIVNTMGCEAYRHYRGGVFSNDDCGGGNMHAVLIVGYGTDSIQGPYWIVKNSWGANWGEAGYIRITRDQNKNCGLSVFAFFVR